MPFYLPYEKKVERGDLVFGAMPVKKWYAQNCKDFVLLRTCPDMNMSSYAVTMLERKRLSDGWNAIDSPDFIEFIRAHPKYQEALTMPYFTGKIVHVATGAIVKEDTYIYDPTSVNRKCKAGIAWAVKSKQPDPLNLARPAHVHFILDGLNFLKLIQKSHAEDQLFKSLDEFFAHVTKNQGGSRFRLERHNNFFNNIQIKHRSVTGSELRWIYRNRNDAQVQEKIQFWYLGRPCCPPWHSAFNSLDGLNTAELWQAYLPRSG